MQRENELSLFHGAVLASRHPNHYHQMRVRPLPKPIVGNRASVHWNQFSVRKLGQDHHSRDMGSGRAMASAGTYPLLLAAIIQKR